MEPVFFTLIFLTGIVASFVGALVGGGGLIKIPLLILLGIPPHMAIATSKLASYGAILSASHKYHQNKKIDWEVFFPFLLAGLIGVPIGASLLIKVQEGLLLKIVGFILLASVPIMIVRKDMGIKKFRTSSAKKGIGFILLTLANVYNGFFGGGTAFFTMPVTMHFFGLDVIEANAARYAPAFFFNILAVLIFWFNGIILLDVAAVLFLGNFAGAYMGAHTAVKKGNETVKALFVAFVLFSAARILFF